MFPPAAPWRPESDSSSGCPPLGRIVSPNTCITLVSHSTAERSCKRQASAFLSVRCPLVFRLPQAGGGLILSSECACKDEFAGIGAQLPECGSQDSEGRSRIIRGKPQNHACPYHRSDARRASRCRNGRSDIHGIRGSRVEIRTGVKGDIAAAEIPVQFSIHPVAVFPVLAIDDDAEIMQSAIEGHAASRSTIAYCFSI